VVEQEGPFFLLTLLPPLLPQFHAFLSIVIVFGHEAAFHLLQLRGHIAAKKHTLPVFLDPEYLVMRRMGPGDVVTDIPIDGSIPLQQHDLVGILQPVEILHVERRSAFLQGEIGFLSIPDLVEDALQRMPNAAAGSLDALIAADAAARASTRAAIATMTAAHGTAAREVRA